MLTTVIWVMERNRSWWDLISPKALGCIGLFLAQPTHLVTKSLNPAVQFLLVSNQIYPA